MPSSNVLRKERGRLLFPVAGGRIEARFGRAVDPRFGTVTLQRGIDVRAPEGTTVVAPHGGKVVHSGWFRGYGNLQATFAVEAHMDKLAEALGKVAGHMLMLLDLLHILEESLAGSGLDRKSVV